jgi:hypothetical protein
MASLWALLWKLICQQPVYCQGVIQAIIALAVSFGLGLTSGQIGSLTAATAAILAFVTQTQVTPIANPRDNAGNQLVPAEMKTPTSSTRAAA